VTLVILIVGSVRDDEQCLRKFGAEGFLCFGCYADLVPVSAMQEEKGLTSAGGKLVSVFFAK
jgi:hypothetical protein